MGKPRLIEGERVRDKFRGDGFIKYIVDAGDCYKYMIVFDNVFPSGHDGNGGCYRYQLPLLPQYRGRCRWCKGADEIESIEPYNLVEEAKSEIYL